MAIPTRLLTATCNIDNGTLTAQNRPPVFTGESGAMEIAVTFKKDGADYNIPEGVVASLYLYYPNTELMTISSEMAVDGATATGTLSESQLAKEGYPMLMIQLQDVDAETVIVAASFPIKVIKSRGSSIIDIRPPSPSEIVYVGRSPYINPNTGEWMQWDSATMQYVDTGVVATGHSPYINPQTDTWMVWDDTAGDYVDTDISATGTNPIDDTAGSGTYTKTWSANKLVSEFGAKADTTDLPGDMTGASSGSAGTHGLVPAPASGDQGKILYGDGTWKNPPSGSGDVQSVNGVQPDGTGNVAITGANVPVSGSDSTKIDSALSGKADASDVYTKTQVDNLIPGDMTGASSSAAGAHGLVPAPSSGDQGKVLYGDGTWKSPTSGTVQSVNSVSPDGSGNVAVKGSDIPVSGSDSTKIDTALDAKADSSSVYTKTQIDGMIPGDMTGASSGTAGTHGLVPQPAAGANTKVLYGDGTWKSPPGGTVQTVNGNSPDINGGVTVKGSDIAVSGSDSTKIDTALGNKADSSSVYTKTQVDGLIPGVMTGASASSAGTSGLTPAPSTGDQDKVLYGDGTWKTPPEGTVKTVNSISPNSNGNVLLKGSDIQLKAMSLQTVAQAIESVDEKTGSDIDTSDTDNTPIATTLSSLNDQIADLQGVVYGIHIDGSESDPSAAVTYLEDAVGLTPAYMDYTEDEFNYGSWENAFFMPRPCMLKYDGTVDYYLDPNDYSKKLDGTASDVANTSYGGNAMMEWGRNGKRIWYAIKPKGDGKSASIYVADHQVDESYKAYNFINKNGDLIDHFYTPCYFGSLDSSTRLRSLSGIAGSSRCKNKTAAQERTAAKLNNPSGIDIWDFECYADNQLITILLWLMGKSLDVQTVFGKGLIDSGSDAINDAFTSGQHNAKGLFYGTNSGAANTYANAVKVFGMENFWGYMWRRELGYMNVNGTLKYKMTAGTQDGSSSSDYVVSTTASDYGGYLTGASLPSASGSYIQKMTYNGRAMTPTDVGGSASTYYCDALWTNNSAVCLSFRGGYSYRGALCGAVCRSLNSAASLSNWSVGGSPSCKPLS